MTLAASASETPSADFYVAPTETTPGRAGLRRQTPIVPTDRLPRSRRPATPFAVQRPTAHSASRSSCCCAAETTRSASRCSFRPRTRAPRSTPITYAAYPGEKPILTGGVPITGWRKGEGLGMDGAGSRGESEGTLVLPLVVCRWQAMRWWPGPPTRAANFSGRPIKPIDRRRTSPRERDQRALPAAACVTRKIKSCPGRTSTTPSWSSITLGRLRGITSPRSTPIARSSTSPIPAAGRSAGGTRPRYYVENVPEALDAPGEFYLDRKTGVLSYYPRPGEDMTKAR
jgi:hypothetical protein